MGSKQEIERGECAICIHKEPPKFPMKNSIDHIWCNAVCFHQLNNYKPICLWFKKEKGL